MGALVCGHDPGERNAAGRCRACHRERVRRSRAEGPRPPRTHCIRGHDLTAPGAIKTWGGRRYCFACKQLSHQRGYQRARARKVGVDHMLPTAPVRELIAREQPIELAALFRERFGIGAADYAKRAVWLTRKYAPLEVVDEFCCALNRATAYVYGDTYLRLPSAEEANG